MSKADMRALSELTDAGFRAVQAELAALQAKQRAIVEQIAALEQDRHDRAHSLPEDDPAMRAGADMLWHRWIDTRRIALNAELARLRAAEEPVKMRLRMAFGRAEASKSLAKKAKKQFVIELARKAERQGL